MRRITSRQNAAVARFRAAARGEAGAPLLLEGAHLVEAALDAGVRIHEAGITTDAAARPEVRAIVARLERARVDVACVSPSVMAALSPARTAPGITALAERPRATKNEIFTRSEIFTGSDALVVGMVDMQDPGNVGAIIRSGEALGATGIVVSGHSADPFGWKALRGSMGSALRLPIVTEDVTTVIGDARRRGCTIISAVPREGTSLFEMDWRRPIFLVIGGEGAGLASSIVDLADARVTIPMSPPVESLNAAIAAAIVLSEATRQRRTDAVS